MMFLLCFRASFGISNATLLVCSASSGRNRLHRDEVMVTWRLKVTKPFCYKWYPLGLKVFFCVKQTSVRWELLQEDDWGNMSELDKTIKNSVCNSVRQNKNQSLSVAEVNTLVDVYWLFATDCFPPSWCCTTCASIRRPKHQEGTKM